MPVTPSRTGPLPTVEEPRWQTAAIAEHLQFFSEVRSVEGPVERQRQLARYLSTRFHEFMLQPALEGDYVLADSAYEHTIILAYVAGREPVIAKQGVLVWVDMDLSAHPYERKGVLAAAALLETARRFSLFAQYYNMPDRSLLFAVSIGTRGSQALRQYLGMPTWDVDDVDALVYVGFDAETTAQRVESLAASYALPLFVVPTPAARAATASEAASQVRRSQALRMSHALFERLLTLQSP